MPGGRRSQGLATAPRSNCTLSTVPLENLSVTAVLAASEAVCAPFVERAIALVNPRLLLLSGGASAKAMLKQDAGILSLRGRWFEWSARDGAMTVPAMPSLHPAFLLRQPAAKKNAWTDLLTLVERLDRPHREP